MNKVSRTVRVYDEEFDVVGVGYGFAGAVSAIEAAQAGAKVLLIEKASVPGGISICSYGSVRCASDSEQAYSYLSATNGGRTSDDVVRVLADGMSELEPYVRHLGRVNGAEITTTKEAGKVGANYPLPGFEAFYQTIIVSIPNFDARAVYPWANGAAGGPMLFKILDDNLANEDVTIRLNTRAVRLLTSNDAREVRGITVEGTDGISRIKARRGVILASGGFEGSPELQDQYWEGRPVLQAAARHNTGDGIRMAQDLGAALWHMWHFHGAYGFKSADLDYPYAIRVKRLPDWRPGSDGVMARRDDSGKITAAQVKMTWILIDRHGKRYMNENPPYTHDTGHRPMHLFDPVEQNYPRIPSYLICDENGRKEYPLGRPTSNDEGVQHKWSDDNLAEVESGILKRADTLEELANLLRLDRATVRLTVDRWNASCSDGCDDEFGRPPGTMMPIAEPPFYGAPVWPVVSNTQGGPVHDSQQHIIDVFGDPIPRLFAAGELGSSFGHLYMSGGNIGECFVTGRVAGGGVAALASWS